MTITLTPVDGVYKALLDLAERSPQSADALARIGLYEALDEQIEQHRDELTKAVLANMSGINKRARAVLLRNHVDGLYRGDAPDDAAYAEALAAADEFIEKGLTGSLLEAFNRRHPRDDEGRFIRANVSARTQTITGAGRNNDVFQRITNQVSRWQQGQLVDDDTPVTIQFRLLDPNTDKPHGSEMTRKTTAGNAVNEAKALVGAGALPHGIAVARRDLKNVSPQQLAAIDLTHLATGADTVQAHRLTQGLFDNGKPSLNGDAMAQRIYGETQGTDRQAYRRIGAVGQALSAASVPGSTGAAIGAVGQLVGNLGPEAEKVLGPGIRRAAYRYRGTEKRPEASIRQGVTEADRYARALSSPDQEGRNKAREALATVANARGEKDPAATIASRYWSAAGISGDQRALGIRGDVVAAHFLGAFGTASILPDRELTTLSLASGEMPPSQGVMVDAEGRVVTQAVGYNGDHYLPFDLRNLNALHGGQYVRTRATGGLTTEDVYTGLLTGARQVQVVSNSGVFTLEFDPDLRGGRRYSDKAKRMIERYGSMLKAIDEKNLYQQDVSPQEKADIKRQVAAATSDPAQRQALYERKLEEARYMGGLGEEESDELEALAEEYANGKVRTESRERLARGETVNAPLRAAIKEEARRQYLRESAPAVRKLRLDGEGYSRAMKALKQEFPFYIRQATYQSIPDFLESRGLDNPQGHKRGAGADVGYVKPGQTNTEAAMQGGFRIARRVPPGRPEQQTSPAAAGAARPVAGAAPAAAPAARPAAEPTARTMADETKAGGTVYNAMMNPLGNLIRARAEIPPEGGMLDPSTTDAQAAGSHGAAWANWKASQLVNEAGLSRAGSAATTWFLTKATPREREELLRGLEELEADAGGYREYQNRAGELRQQYEQVKDLFDIVEPFAPEPEGGQNPAAVRPEGDDPKPQRFKDIVPEVTADEQTFSQRRKMLELGIDEIGSLKQELADMAPLTPGDRADYVEERLKPPKDGEAEMAAAAAVRAQVAWSFLAAEEASGKLRRLAGGGAGPKAPEPGEARKSHSPDPLAQFLLDLRAEVDGLLERQ